MKNAIILVMLFMPFFMTAQLPDFSKAKQIDLVKLRLDTISLYDGRKLKLLNPCEVGDYEAEFYTTDGDVLYRVFSRNVQYIKAVGYFAEWSKEERYELSSEMATLGTGRWYAVIKSVGCGYVFEYEVENHSVRTAMYELVCK